MKLTVNTIQGCCESVKIDCSPTEWLIISKALLMLSKNEDVHEDDRRTAEKMRDAYPVFREVESEKKLKCRLHYTGEGDTYGEMMLTKEEFETVKRVSNTDNWDNLLDDEYSGVLIITRAGEREEE